MRKTTMARMASWSMRVIVLDGMLGDDGERR